MRDAGHDAIHVVADLDRCGANDRELVDFALDQSRIVVSADTDFGELVAANKLTSPSIVLFRRQQRRPDVQAKILLDNLADLAEALLSGAIVVIESKRIRVRLLPI